MKRIISVSTIVAIIVLFVFSVKTYAASLNSVTVDTDKTTVRPGEQVKVTVEFGESLGAYTVDVAYDNNIFEYVSAEGGTPNNTGDKVRVVFHDSSGGTNPRTNMSVTFKAKDDITTSNPTDFSITAEGLSNPDTSVTYDDITIPIKKSLTVEPLYEDYTLKLESTGAILVDEENEMTLSYSSSIGRYYDHARLVAEATTPSNATVKLLATDESQIEHDIIQEGWGDAQGFKIGGKDVSQVLQVRGVFSDPGEYTITLKLIDKDNSDNVIAEETFNFTATEQTTQIPSVPETTPEENNPEILPSEEEDIITEEEQTKTEQNAQNAVQTPTQLPKTGINLYAPAFGVLAALASSYVFLNRKK